MQRLICLTVRQQWQILNILKTPYLILSSIPLTMKTEFTRLKGASSLDLADLKNSQAISNDVLIDFLTSHEIADYNNVDLTNLKHFVTPDTSLYLLTLLSKAEDQGLDLIYVDRDKLDRSTNSDVGFIKFYEKGPWEGASYVDIDLSFLLYEGSTFCYTGIVEGMGYQYCLITMNLLGYVTTHFDELADREHNFEYLDLPIETVNDLLLFINGEMTLPKVIHPPVIQLWYWFRKTWVGLIYRAIAFIVYIFYKIIAFLILKPIYRIVAEFLFEISQPVGYKRFK
jgi:hypothetical protein